MKEFEHYFSWMKTKEEAIRVIVLIINKFDLIPEDLMDEYRKQIKKMEVSHGSHNDGRS